MGNLGNRETCGPERRRDHSVRIELNIRLLFFTLSSAIWAPPFAFMGPYHSLAPCGFFAK